LARPGSLNPWQQIGAGRAAGAGGGGGGSRFWPVERDEESLRLTLETLRRFVIG
jgi:hypothetical protein